MRDKWSILVIMMATDGSEIKSKVIDFGSPGWAEAAVKTIRATHVDNIFINAIPLF